MLLLTLHVLPGQARAQIAISQIEDELSCSVFWHGRKHGYRVNGYGYIRVSGIRIYGYTGIRIYGYTDIRIQNFDI